LITIIAIIGRLCQGKKWVLLQCKEKNYDYWLAKGYEEMCEADKTIAELTFEAQREVL
jgi:hypothetical protein